MLLNWNVVFAPFTTGQKSNFEKMKIYLLCALVIGLVAAHEDCPEPKVCEETEQLCFKPPPPQAAEDRHACPPRGKCVPKFGKLWSCMHFIQKNSKNIGVFSSWWNELPKAMSKATLSQRNEHMRDSRGGPPKDGRRMSSAPASNMCP